MKTFNLFMIMLWISVFSCHGSDLGLSSNRQEFLQADTELFKTAIENYKRVVKFHSQLDLKNHHLNIEKIAIGNEVRLRDSALKYREEVSTQKNRVQTSLTIGFTILVFLLVIIYIYFRRNLKAKIQIASQDRAISNLLEERESLLREIHHRVKNNLQVIASLLYLQSRKFDDADFKKVLEEGQGRVRSMALIHQKLYENDNLKVIPFGDYLRELTHEIKNSVGLETKNVHIDIKAKQMFIDIEKAVPLGLIVNELTTNSMKYAFNGIESGSIMIFLTQEDGEFTLTVKDDGVGLPDEIDLNKTRSLGLRLVRMLSQQLEGEFRMQGDCGTIFELKFTA